MAQGHHVDVLTTDVDGPDRLDVPLNHPIDMEGVAVHYCPLVTPRRIYFSPELARRAARLLPKTDAVHINGMFLWPGPHLARQARAQRKVLVISPRGMLIPEFVAGKSRLAKNAWIALLERRSLAAASAIHTTSDIEADGVRSMRLDLAPIAVIPNGVDTPSRHPSRAETDEFWCNIPRGRRIAFLGRLDWTKGVELALIAARSHPDAFILIAGPDPIGIRESCQPLLTRPDGSRCGAFIGPISRHAKWAFLAGADVLVAPSLHESFGMSVAEAMIAGTPTIATDGVGASSMLRRIDPDLVVPRDQFQVTAAVHRLLNDSVRATRIGEALKRLASAELSWQSIATRMSAVYQQILPRP